MKVPAVIIALSSFIIAATACGPTTGQEPAADEAAQPQADVVAAPSAEEAQAAITEAIDLWEAAWNAGDAAGMVALYTDDAMLLPPGGEPVSHEAIQAFWQDAIDEQAGVQIALETLEVDSYGDVAIEVGSYVFTDADGGHIDHGKYVVMWKNVDGSWRLTRDIWNSSMTP